jgi:dephospho-CoA kinase
MKVIGLTGGIGSGKSLVAKILQEKYDADILLTDDIARKQMEPGGASYQEVVEYFGKGILTEDGSIDRKKLAQIVFEDKEKRLKINEITHPKVLDEVMRTIQTLKNGSQVPYLVVETALMIEAGFDCICDEVWYVFTPEDERRNRLKKERNYSDEKIDSIFSNQSREEVFRVKFPKVIENVGDIRKIEQQIEQLIRN